MTLAHSNKPTLSKNVSILIISGIFALAGTVCLIIGFFNDIVSWLKEFGLAMLVILLPIIAFIIHTIRSKKIKEM